MMNPWNTVRRSLDALDDATREQVLRGMWDDDTLDVTTRSNAMTELLLGRPPTDPHQRDAWNERCCIVAFQVDELQAMYDQRPTVEHVRLAIDDLDDDFAWNDSYDTAPDPPAPTYDDYRAMIHAVLRDGETALPQM